MFAKSQMTNSSSNRIVTLERQIKWVEKNNSNNNNNNDDDDVNRLKQQLANLLKEEEKNDLLRRLPLYNSRMTGYKWICSECWDQVYWLSRQIKKTKTDR